MLNIFEKKFLQHVIEHLIVKKGDRVLLALSGGSDSVALFFLLNKISNVLKLELAAVHCNFLLRPSSNDDEAFCRSLCQKFSTPFFLKVFNTMNIAKERKQSIETVARDLRYDFFLNIAKTYQFNKIATAHHADDNAETVLFNLFRGGSLWLLKGIPDISSREIIRPLLPFKKKDLLLYLQSMNQSYQSDETNLTEKFDRNFIRNRIIPTIEERFKNKFFSNLLNFSNTVKEASDYINDIVKSEIENVYINHSIQLERFLSLHVFIQKEILMLILHEHHLRVSTKILKQLVKLSKMEKGKRVVLSKTVRAEKQKNEIVFYSIETQQKCDP